MPTALLTGLVGALLLVPIELFALAPLSGSLALTASALLLLLGGIAGAVMAVAEAVVARLRLSGGRAALVHALGAALPFALVARSLFAGGFASTLPGAASASIWLPLVGTLGVAAAIALLAPVAARPLPRRGLSIGLVALALLVELANRRLYRSLYPDLHAFLMIAAVILAGLAARLAIPVELVDKHRRWLGRLGFAGALAALVLSPLAIRSGLRETKVRWALATKGNHARQLARLLRSTGMLASPGTTTLAGDPGHPPTATPPQPPAPSQNPAAPPEKLTPPVDHKEETAALIDATRRMNILLISVDALRADMVRETPENQRELPTMSQLLSSSRRFRLTFAPSSATDMSIGCLLSGRYAPFTGPPIAQTLPEIFAAEGRLTHAVLPREALRWAGETLLTRGFRSWDRVITDPEKTDVGSRTTSAETTDRGLAFLDRHRGELDGRGFFLWLHYFDVHEHAQLEKSVAGLRALVAGKKADPAESYRALLRLVDREIGRALSGLKERGLAEKTVVIFLSDHGESLGEDPRFPEAHGHFVYNTLIHVPLAIAIPGVAAGAIETPISLVDLTPTILELAGLSVPSFVESRSLLRYLLKAIPSEPLTSGRPFVINESDQYALIRWPMKVLVRHADQLVELYDIERDFHEQSDLSEAQPAVVEELLQIYRQFPKVSFDRSPQGRRLRDQQARPPGRPVAAPQRQPPS